MFEIMVAETFQKEKNLPENICNGVCVDRSGLHASFPRNFGTTAFRNIAEQLFQLCSQIDFGMLSQVIFFSVFNFHFYEGMYLPLHNFIF